MAHALEIFSQKDGFTQAPLACSQIVTWLGETCMCVGAGEGPEEGAGQHIIHINGTRPMTLASITIL